MKHSVLLLFCLALGSVDANARLGETEAQLIQRFGPEVGARSSSIPGTTPLSFKKRGFSITVELIGGVSALETYVDNSSITPYETTYLLGASAQGHSWASKQTDPSGWVEWKRDDGARASQYANAITFMSPAYLAAQKAYEKEQATRVNGF